MKVLLTFPPYSMKERYNSNVGEDIGGHLPPLGLCYIASVLEEAGHEVRIMDCPTYKQTQQDVVNEVLSWKPEIIGLAAITILIDRAIEITKAIKETSPKTIVVIGGPHPTQMPEETLRDTGCDIVIKGEAELTFRDIATDPKPFLKQKIVEGTMVKDLNTFPLPARHLLDMKRYNSLPNNYKVSENVFQMMTTRGCPYTCTFCASANGKYRQRSVENVIKEIKHLKEKYNVQEIAFWDDIFTMNKKWVLDFCKALETENIKIAWTCESRLDLINEEIVQAMAKAGCWNMFFGIESGDQEILDNIKKKTTLEMVRKGIAMVKKTGMEVRGSFILGLPGETPEKGKKTIDFAIELDPDYAQFSIATPFPGTELWDTADKWGTLEKNFKDYHIFAPVFLVHGYPNIKELQKMQHLAFKKFYLRPSYILKRISRIRNLRDVKRSFKGLKMVLGMSGMNN